MASCFSSPRPLCAFALSAACAAFLAACDGLTGGYPPPPPLYEPPAAEMTKAQDPKFQPLIKALLAQRKASKGDFSMLAKKTDDEGKPLSSFAASRAAADAMLAALHDAQLSAEDMATYNVFSSLDDAALEKLVK
jgi:hypothetical protein